jgi:hypothetical protein
VGAVGPVEGQLMECPHAAGLGERHIQPQRGVMGPPSSGLSEPSPAGLPLAVLLCSWPDDWTPYWRARGLSSNLTLSALAIGPCNISSLCFRARGLSSNLTLSALAIGPCNISSLCFSSSGSGAALSIVFDFVSLTRPSYGEPPSSCGVAYATYDSSRIASAAREGATPKWRRKQLEK